MPYDLSQFLADEVMEQRVTCPKCGAQIVEYHRFTGLMPDEVDGERRATHHWRACELNAALRARDETHLITTRAFERETNGSKRYYAQVHVALGWPIEVRIPKALHDLLRKS